MSRTLSMNALSTLIKLVALVSLPFVAFGQMDSENSLILEGREALEKDGPEGLKRHESKASQMARKAVVREGDRLTLRLRSGKIKTFTDRPECASGDIVVHVECMVYRLSAYARSRGLFVVIEGHHEGGRYILVDDRSGQETKIDAIRGVVLLSRSGNLLLVCLENDEVRGFEVQVWRRNRNSYVEEWFGSPFYDRNSYISYSVLRWSSEGVIEMQARINQPVILRNFTLRLLKGKWEVATPPAQRTQ